jgi:hypothetical protein
VSGGGCIAAELRDECLNQEIFYSLKEAQIVIEQWRNQYNTIRHTHRSDIGRLRRRHPRANQSTWIVMLQSSNLYLLGPKYPSDQRPAQEAPD